MIEDDSNIFSIMPMNQRFSLSPGKSYQGTVSIINPANATADFSYKAEVTPYSVTGQEYAADLATINNQSTIINWITIDNPTGVVKPNGIAEVHFTIDVPEDAIGGGQYATITISSDKNAKSDANVTINNIFEMASIIYAQVEGEIIHSGDFQNLNAPSFVISYPIETTATFKNDGNSHEEATISTHATNYLTGDMVPLLNDKAERFTEIIMPGTERTITQEFSPELTLGAISLEQTVYYMGKSFKFNNTIIICPIWFIGLVVIILGIIATVTTYIIIKHRHRKSDLAL